jgi:hypothetical protein
MAKDTTMTTSRASLCALGEYLKQHCFFAPLREQVQIPQKTVRYRPIDKLLDGLLGILCGAKTIWDHSRGYRRATGVWADGLCRAVDHCAHLAGLYGGDG